MVSVIIPTYNREGTIQRAIDSVLNQTYSDLEVIVVDDASDDNTFQAVRKISDSRVRYIRLDNKAGACVARNKGIEIAKGSIIAFQDSDDEWTDKKLQIQLNAMEKHGADICFCSVKRHYPENEQKTIIWPESIEKRSRMLDHEFLRKRSYVSTQTIIAKRKVFDSYIFDPNVSKGQDYDWIIRASKTNRVYYVADALVNQYLQPDSISVSGASRFIESRSYFLEKYSELCEIDPEFKAHQLQQLAHYKMVAGIDSTNEYKELFKIEKNLHNLMCVVLSHLHMMNLASKLFKIIKGEK